MQVLTATNLEESTRLRGDWLRVRQGYGLNTPNSDPERFSVTVSSFGEGIQPCAVMFRDGAIPKAAILGRTVCRPVACRIGYVTFATPTLRCLEIVYGGLIADANPAVVSEVVHHLRGLLDSGRIEHVMVNRLPLDHPLYRPLLALRAVRTGVDPHWRVEICPGDYEASIGRFSAKHRKNVRYYDRRMVKAFDDDVWLDVFSTRDRVDELLELCSGVSAETYQAALGVGLKDDATTRKLLMLEAEHERLRSYVLRTKSQPLAFQIGMVYGTRFICSGRGYRPEFRDLRLGNLLFFRMMRDLCEAGVDCIDLGFGDAEYKNLYGTDYSDEETLHLYGRGLRATLAWEMDRFSRASAWLLREAVVRTGSMNRIKRLWRSRLERGN